MLNVPTGVALCAFAVVVFCVMQYLLEMEKARQGVWSATKSGWCCTIKVDIENSKGQYIEKDKQEATKDGSESTKIQHGI